MQEVVIRFKDLFPEFDSLVLRTTGFEVRKQIQDLLNMLPDDSIIENDTLIILDFNGIELITQGFGDEIVGVFTRLYGVDFIKRHFKVINANEFIRGTLNWVISYSKKMRAERQGATV